MLKPFIAAVALLCLTATPVAAASPILMVLQETGQFRNNAPVLKADPAPEEILSVLSQGFSGRMLRLYNYEQTFLSQKTGAPREPAYLLLSGDQGGFPRFGFVLDGVAKPQAGFVDLNRRSRSQLVGRAGAMDQIFPHELFHIIRQQLSGPRTGASGKLHAVGVQTDRVTALDEGFAESLQIMAIDDPQAEPATKAAFSNPLNRRDMENALVLYRQAVEARWAPGARELLTFPLWYSGTEQMARYYLVKENAFARAPELPAHLVGTAEGDMLENVLPGEPGAPPKSAAQMLETEGVVSYLFYRWATNPVLQNTYEDDAFYAQFGASRSDIAPVENVYLKMFYVFYLKQPQDTAQVITDYKVTFPDEGSAVDDVVRDAFLGQPLPVAGSIWLMNGDFRVGLNIYDQLLAHPTPNVFDLNATTLTDLITIQGVTPSLAAAIQQGAPYQNVDALAQVPGMTPEVLNRFRQMAGAYTRGASTDAEASADISGILMADLWRILLLLAVSWSVGTLLYHWLQPVNWMRATINGLAAATSGMGITLLTGIMNHGGLRLGPDGLVAVVFVLSFFGLPATAGRLIRRRGVRQAVLVLGAWGLAALPAAIMVHPWF